MKSTYIIKRYLIGSVTGLCLLFATQVHADFRKALDAYQNRDGDTMLKEVKDAVDTKNDDGLMLLLMATNDAQQLSIENNKQDLIKLRIKNFEMNDDSDIANLPYEICKEFKLNESNIAMARQRYLWCVLGDKYRGVGTVSDPASGFVIGNMHVNGELKRLDPELDSIWSDRTSFNKYLKKLPLPDLLLTVRRELADMDLPEYSFYFKDELIPIDSSYMVSIFKDGRIKIVVNEQVFQLKSDSNEVKQFVKEFQKFNLDKLEQPSYESTGSGNCDFVCKKATLQMTLRDGLEVRRLFLTTLYNDFNEKVMKSDAFGLLRYKNRMQMAKVRSLVENHFPTIQTRCLNENTDELRLACFEREKAWDLIEKGGK